MASPKDITLDPWIPGSGSKSQTHMTQTLPSISQLCSQMPEGLRLLHLFAKAALGPCAIHGPTSFSPQKGSPLGWCIQTFPTTLQQTKLGETIPDP